MSSKVIKCGECGKLLISYKSDLKCMYCGKKTTGTIVWEYDDFRKETADSINPHSSIFYLKKFRYAYRTIEIDLPNEPTFLKATQYANEIQKQALMDIQAEWESRRDKAVADITQKRSDERKALLDEFRFDEKKEKLSKKITQLRSMRRKLADLKMQATDAKLDADAYMKMIKIAAGHFEVKITTLSSEISAKTEINDAEKEEYESAMKLIVNRIELCSDLLQENQLIKNCAEYEKHKKLQNAIETENKLYETSQADITHLSNEISSFIHTIKEHDIKSHLLLYSARFGNIDFNPLSGILYNRTPLHDRNVDRLYERKFKARLGL